MDARGEGVRRGEGEREFEETGTPRSRERFRIVEGVFSSHKRPSVSPSVVVERLSLSELRTLWNTLGFMLSAPSYRVERMTCRVERGRLR